MWVYSKNAILELTGKGFSSEKGIDARVLARLAVNNALDFNEASWDVGGRFGWSNR